MSVILNPVMFHRVYSRLCHATSLCARLDPRMDRASQRAMAVEDVDCFQSRDREHVSRPGYTQLDFVVPKPG